MSSKKIIKKFRYLYDENGICAINYIKDGKDNVYNLVRDSVGNISKVMYNGRLIGEYTYDAWGNHAEVLFTDSNLTDSDKYIFQNNPFRFKGYYLDLDTKLYYCQTRYYYPVIYQWLSPDKFEYLDYKKVNGLNLYCYCFNNPVSFVDVNGNEPLTIFLIILLGSLITVTLLAVETPNAETTGPSFEPPSIGTVSEDGLTIFSAGGNLGRKDWYLDESKEKSIYFSGFNLGASIGIPKDMKSEKDLFSVDCSIFKFGYDGKYIDLNIALGPKQEFINVDIVAIIRDIKELFKK